MADTQRTRAALLTLLADNVTGQISAQDMRDVLVTIMESEFTNPGDFWTDPEAQYTTTDRDVRGWIMHSQTVDSSLSMGNIVYMTASGTWKATSPSTSGENFVCGMLGESTAAGDSDVDILRRGVAMNSLWSARFSGQWGEPVWLQSGMVGSLSITIPTAATMQKIIGHVLPPTSASGGGASGKMYFDPTWTIVGT